MSAENNQKEKQNELCTNDDKEENYYEVLNATMHATLDELKRNYIQLIKQHHPDKLQQRQQSDESQIVMDETEAGIDLNSECSSVSQEKSKENCDNIAISLNSDNTTAKFLLINRAWNTLKNPSKRKLYDAELLQREFHSHNNVFATISVNQMTIHSSENQNLNESELSDTITYTYDCRCGGQYILDESTAIEEGLINSSKIDKKTRDCPSKVYNEPILIECSECSLVVVIEKE